MSKKEFEIWEYKLPADVVTDDVREYLAKYSSRKPTVEDLWNEMNRVWDELGLFNDKSFLGQPIANYYSHPVWILNGFFSASDADSVSHRNAIVNFVSQLNGKRVADYGGGFGELSIRLALKLPLTNVSIIEPYPSAIGLYRTSNYTNISVLSELGRDYDVVIAQDVLEHVEDPLHLVTQLAESTKFGGHVVFANCFYPVIKCHLPSTFHLRNTFSWVVKAAGLEFVGIVPGTTHVQVYRKIGSLDQKELRRRECYSKSFGELINFLKDGSKDLLRSIVKLFK